MKKQVQTRCRAQRNVPATDPIRGKTAGAAAGRRHERFPFQRFVDDVQHQIELKLAADNVKRRRTDGCPLGKALQEINRNRIV